MIGITNGHNGDGQHEVTRVAVAARDRDPTDAQMEQIRDLLFGSLKSELDARLGALEQRVRSLEHQLAEARQQDDDKRRAAFDGLARSIASLGAEISQLART